MPWCEDCDRFYAQPTLTSDGHCPQGHLVADPGAPVGFRQSDAPPRVEEPEPKVPWHFWLLLVGVIGYLLWRFIQLLGWIF